MIRTTMTKEKFYSRKWNLVVYTMLVSTLALFTSYISESTFMNIVMLCVGVYGASNTAEKFARSHGDYKKLDIQ